MKPNYDDVIKASKMTDDVSTFNESGFFYDVFQSRQTMFVNFTMSISFSGTWSLYGLIQGNDFDDVFYLKEIIIPIQSETSNNRNFFTFNIFIAMVSIILCTYFKKKYEEF